MSVFKKVQLGVIALMATMGYVQAEEVEKRASMSESSAISLSDRDRDMRRGKDSNSKAQEQRKRFKDWQQARERNKDDRCVDCWGCPRRECPCPSDCESTGPSKRAGRGAQTQQKRMTRGQEKTNYRQEKGRW